MRTRPMLSPGKIYTLLKEAFDAKRPAGCVNCRIPLPFVVERPDEVSANWRIGTPVECPHKCHALLAELAMDLASRYDMNDYTVNEPASKAR